MRWRPIRRPDLSRCLDIQPACLGDGIVGHETALRVWHDLLEQPGFHGTVIESGRPIAGHTIVVSSHDASSRTIQAPGATCGESGFEPRVFPPNSSPGRGPARPRHSLTSFRHGLSARLNKRVTSCRVRPHRDGPQSRS